MLSSWLPANDQRIVAACCVLLLYVGFCILTWRRHKRSHANSGPTSTATTLVAYASQTGFAQQLALQTATSMRSIGQSVGLESIRDVGIERLASAERILFVVSTTGEGDAPDPAANFVRSVLAASAQLQRLSYAILALGDRQYDNFCGFGHRLDSWLRHQGATPLFDVVEVDNGDEGALRHWQHQLGVLAGAPDLPDWDTPRYDRWRLTERRLLNPGSAGQPCFHLTLRPTDPAATWTAGDIAEIDPANSTWVSEAGQTLPHREYSIASIPADGAIELLVRQMRRPGGEVGIGSGWLTETAPLDGEIALRVRSNPNFHPPTDLQPLLLIGNGTGLAGLRAILKARIAGGAHRNWLFFGERHRAADYFHENEIELWHRQGCIERLDVVFSRDQPERLYVQHRLLSHASEVREWTAAGASIYVCGSLEGMAPAVDAALREILGADALEQLLITGRYRRDVY
ncbi:MAG: sulfite reductase subunit alpha [Steroidobacteraceae bacterium]